MFQHFPFHSFWSQQFLYIARISSVSRVSSEISSFRVISFIPGAFCFTIYSLDVLPPCSFWLPWERKIKSKTGTKSLCHWYVNLKWSGKYSLQSSSTGNHLFWPTWVLYYTRTRATAVTYDAVENHLGFLASCLECYQFLSISKGDQRTETQFGGRSWNFRAGSFSVPEIHRSQIHALKFMLLQSEKSEERWAIFSWVSRRCGTDFVRDRRITGAKLSKTLQQRSGPA